MYFSVIDAIFDSEGPLSKIFKGYQLRKGQVCMAKAVYATLLDNKTILVEAPTGTGKSLGAGIPAALKSALTGDTVVYCTANKILQDQLSRIDLPVIAQVINSCCDDPEDEFHFGLIKGMANYVCQNALEESEESGLLPKKTLRVIQDFVESVPVADRAELESFISDQDWAKVSVGPEYCLGKECPVPIVNCHVNRAKAAVNNCHLIITNYHILFIDAEIRKQTGGLVGLLPPYTTVVMDEAHEVPEIAMSFRGYSISYASINKIRSILQRAINQETSQLLKRLNASFNSLQDNFNYLANRFSILVEPIGQDYGAISALYDTANFFRHQAEMLKAHGGEDDSRRVARLRQLGGSCIELATKVQHVSYGMKDPENSSGDGKNVGSFPKDHVFFFERQGQSDKFKLSCKVLDASDWLYKNIFSKKSSVVTSATLSAGKDLSFLAKRLGLKEGTFEQLIVESPFDGSRMLSIVPEDAPDVNSNEFPAYLARKLFDILTSVKGKGVLGLFTSYKNLNEVARLVKLCLPNVLLLVQGTLEKRLLIEHFKAAHKKGQNALILATSSFWQGVDIPGQALSVVFIDKIPFYPPDDPVYWYLSQKDPAAFFKEGVPSAIVRLKQAVGRLLRRDDDYGAVVICDHRLDKKVYGKRIKNAILPEDCFTSSSILDIPEFFAQFE